MLASASALFSSLPTRTTQNAAKLSPLERKRTVARGCRRKQRPGPQSVAAGSSSEENLVTSSTSAAEPSGENMKSATEGELLVSTFARIDTDRSKRTGFPEVVWGPGKTAQQIASILQAMADRQPRVMATRIDASMYEQVSVLLPGVVYHSAARILTYSTQQGASQTNSSPFSAKEPKEMSSMGLRAGSSAEGEEERGGTLGRVSIVCAGTSDLPVAEEVRVTADFMGFSTFLVVDVGVAGLHRLLKQIDRIREADVVVVVAGMDGALPSVVAGLVEAPVIAVPTSIGYGASFGGVAALLTMLNSCSPGLTVVNIDNGFGAALAAGRILRQKRHKAMRDH